MKSIFSILDEISHQLNAPLAGAQSYAYLARRAIEKKDEQKAAAHLAALDERLLLIVRRVDLVITAMNLESQKTPITYSFFPVSVLTGIPTMNHEMMGDKTLLEKALEHARHVTGGHQFEVHEDTHSFTVVFPRANKQAVPDKDTETELLERSIILHRIVSLHGGTIAEDEEKITITLPYKPPRR